MKTLAHREVTIQVFFSFFIGFFIAFGDSNQGSITNLDNFMGGK